MAAQPRLTFPPQDAVAYEQATHKFTNLASATASLPEDYPKAEPGTNQWTVPSSNNPGWLDRQAIPAPMTPEEWMNSIHLSGKGVEVYPTRNDRPRMGNAAEAPQIPSLMD